ncbi:hypothetical protein Fcan01_16287, partial [Folsomia candida]
MERMKVAIENLQLSDDKILAKMLADKCSEEEYQAEYDSMDKYRDEWSDFCVKKNDNISLASMYDDLESNLRGLESLGVTFKESAAFLYPMIESGLPIELVKVWQRSALSGYGDEEIKPVEERLTCLMKFIRAEVKGAQRLTFVIPSQKQPEKDKKKDNHRGEGYHKSDVATAAGLFSGQSSTCIFCDKNHASVDCWRGPQMTMKEKNGRVRDRKCCYKQHVVVMCPEVAQKAQEQEARPVDREEIRGGTPSAMTSHECAGDVLLQTLLVRIYNNDKSRYRVARLVFDNGSQGSSVRRDTAEALRLEPVGEVWSRKVLFGGQLTERRRHNRLRVTLSSPDGNTQRDLEVLDEPEICGRLRRIPKGPWLEELAQNRIMLSDMKSQNPEIEVLVGNDYFGQLMTGRVVQLACGLTAM